MIKLRKLMSLGLACSLSLSVLAGCGAKAADEQGIIYSNADDEAITAMSNALDANGYEGRYIFETFGTSELGGKLLAEGTNLEADLVTMSTFYLQSAQEQNGMFLPLEFDVNTLEAVPDYTAPITSQEGAIILNTEVLAEAGQAGQPAGPCRPEIRGTGCGDGYPVLLDRLADDTGACLRVWRGRRPGGAARHL